MEVRTKEKEELEAFLRNFLKNNPATGRCGKKAVLSCQQKAAGAGISPRVRACARCKRLNIATVHGQYAIVGAITAKIRTCIDSIN